MFVVGLTGGIGSGKSTVAQLFAERGVPIIDADVISREITQPDSPAFLDIIDHFNQELLLEDGTLDRTKLRNIIFEDPNERRWLEELLHPLIRSEMNKRIKKITAPYCIAVIPLLLEVEFYSFINRILVVDAPENLQVDRVTARDKSQKAHVEAILKAQANRLDRLARAQDLIINDGNLEDLIPQVEKLHEKYLEMSKTK